MLQKLFLCLTAFVCSRRTSHADLQLKVIPGYHTKYVAKNLAVLLYFPFSINGFAIVFHDFSRAMDYFLVPMGVKFMEINAIMFSLLRLKIGLSVVRARGIVI